jgi:hypothetical protein
MKRVVFFQKKLNFIYYLDEHRVSMGEFRKKISGCGVPDENCTELLDKLLNKNLRGTSFNKVYGIFLHTYETLVRIYHKMA